MRPLCLDGEGWRWASGGWRGAVCTAPTTDRAGLRGLEAEKGRVGVQRGRCTPAGFTFGVNKVWKPAWGRVNALESYHNVVYIYIYRLYGVTWWSEEGELELRGTEYNVVKKSKNWCLCFLSLEIRCVSWGVKNLKMDSLLLKCELKKEKEAPGNIRFLASTGLNWTAIQIHHLKRTTTSQGGFSSAYLICYLCQFLVICSLFRILSAEII